MRHSSIDGYEKTAAKFSANQHSCLLITDQSQSSSFSKCIVKANHLCVSVCVCACVCAYACFMCTNMYHLSVSDNAN